MISTKIPTLNNNLKKYDIKNTTTRIIKIIFIEFVIFDNE